MKILYLHQYFNTPSMKGGTRSYEMAKRMVARGHDVHMITTRRDGEGTPGKWTVEDVEGITVHWLAVPYHNGMPYSERIKAFFQFAMKAAKKAVEVGGDIIYATSTPLTIAIPAVKAKKRLNIPMVFEVRDLWPELPIAMGALKSPVTKFLAKRLEKYAYFNSEHVVALSPGMAKGIEKVGYSRKRISTIPNSCDLELFNINDSCGQEFIQSRPWLAGGPLVLYAGTLGHINDVSWLASLAEKVNRLEPNIRFLVIGEGVDEKKLYKRAESLGVLNKNFFIEKQIPKSQIPNALNAATVCSSLFLPIEEMWANSANKFFDALAAGKPVVINYKGWQKEIIEEHNVGVHLDYCCLEEAARKLISLATNLEECKKVGERARELAEQKFSRDKLANDLIGVIEQVGDRTNV